MSFSKKGRLLLFFLLLLCLIAGVTIYFSSTDSANPVPEQPIDISESMAAVLYSTSLTAEYDNDGKSILAFIHESGEISSYETTGLESNAIVKLDNELLLHEKDQVTAFTDEGQPQHHPFEACSVYSGYGQSTGSIIEKDLSYSMFNQSYSEDQSYYISTIRWSIGDSFYCETIEEYVLTDGVVGDKLYLLTTDIIEHRGLSLIEVDFQTDQLNVQAYPLNEELTEDLLVFSKLITDQNDQLYVLLSDYEDSVIYLKLMHIDLNQPSIIGEYVLKEYSLEDDPIYFIFNKNAVQPIQGKLYFPDGFGDMYSFHLSSKEISHEFSFLDYAREEYENDEMVYIKDDLFYFFRYDEQENRHILEEYQLDGERTKQIEISTELQELIRNERVHIYDFKMLD
ncbi:hypothetical protein [Bacillus horti]|uniref:Uncharacterized protein n=1 Tax=Caldalkalibacillus horti TaxID=77523 RepID=A0ABT9W2C7_9BACI|nr:hypothetical protein [Bacillus horti]MDQ0167409.1 hypothetical protein [Bacillus horti]